MLPLPRRERANSVAPYAIRKSSGVIAAGSKVSRILARNVDSGVPDPWEMWCSSFG
jgi:hypothetical protein